MRPAGATNFKWSMADVDFVVGLARSGRTAQEIVERLAGGNGPSHGLPTFRRITATPEEIRELCWQSGLTVRQAPRLAL
jgi:hypothetical protein